MGEPYLGEIRCFGFDFPPKNWAQCAGQVLPISQNQALFALIGTIFGGDGNVTFGMPNLRGRTPIGMDGSLFQIGAEGGETLVHLTEDQIPAHTHTFGAFKTEATQFAIARDRYLAAGPKPAYVNAATNLVKLADKSVSDAGSGSGHENVQPTLVMNYCIALAGAFPPKP
ncbi:Phage tail protein [Sulfidibacter corallicola]|uniref:Phage tail protein n=1 Tax=Sulfidibacter corallicola TaxID=2818388 RepID=A0A8A4TSA8_SULCO|nr:tail fiber protein [Sulfidibacter corallicola]QTD51911.1 phage tail protein [Sulfidibacter corallicola]